MLGASFSNESQLAASPASSSASDLPFAMILIPNRTSAAQAVIVVAEGCGDTLLKSSGERTTPQITVQQTVLVSFDDFMSALCLTVRVAQVMQGATKSLPMWDLGCASSSWPTRRGASPAPCCQAFESSILGHNCRKCRQLLLSHAARPYILPQQEFWLQHLIRVP